MTQQEITNIVNTLRQMNKRDAMFNTAVSVEFTRLYEKLFPGETLCSTCTNKIGAAYDRIASLSIDRISIMSQQNKYSFQNPDDLVDLSFSPVAGVPIHLTRHNLTDEIAEKLIAKNEKFRQRFIIKSGAHTSSKASPAKEKSATTTINEEQKLQQRVEAFDNDLSKADVIAKLKESQIPFKASDTKIELIQLLIASEANSQ
jgi:hypothetical protein